MSVNDAFIAMLSQHFEMLSRNMLRLRNGYIVSFEIFNNLFCFHYVGGPLYSSQDIPDLFEYKVSISDPNATKYIIDCLNQTDKFRVKE